MFRCRSKALSSSYRRRSAPSFAAALDEAKIFPVIDTSWAERRAAVAQLHPAAVLVAMSGDIEPRCDALAKQIAAPDSPICR